MKIESYKLKNGQTRYKFNIYLGIDPLTGKEVRTNRRGFKTKKQAEIEYIKLSNNGIMNQDNATFRQVSDQWLDLYENTVKPATFIKAVGLFNNHLYPYLGNKKIDAIDPTIMQNLIVLKSKEISEFKLLNTYARRVFKYAKSLGYTNDDPTKDIIYPVINKPIDEDDINYWTKEEAIEFLNYSKNDMPIVYYTFMRLSIYTGARRGELLSLKWSDINLINKTLRINKAYSRAKEKKYEVSSPKTKASIRTISIDDETISILKEWKKYQKDNYKILNIDNLTFTSVNGTHLNVDKPRKWMMKIIKNNNLRKIRLHDLRHTHASLCFEAGLDIKEVQYRLGHKDIKTTLNIYVHVTKNKELQSAQKFSNFMSS